MAHGSRGRPDSDSEDKTHLTYEALAVREIEVERARRRLERLRRASDNHGDGAARQRQDVVERLSVRRAYAKT